MTSRDFAYWLQGFFEISGEELETIQKPQLDQIKKHLRLVFVHEIDPSYGGAEEQAKLNQVHAEPIKPSPSAPGWPPAKNTKPGGPVARC